MVPALTPNTVLTVLFWGVYFVLGVAAFICVAYLLALLISAARRRREPTAAPVSPLPRYTVVIPAHNEEMVLGTTLRSLSLLDYPQDRYRVIVIADNCDDTTADIARDAGATVLVRFNKELRGKGYALEWAFSQLLAETDFRTEAYIIVDADTLTDRNFLNAMTRRLWANVPPERRMAHRAALQGRYGVLNVGDAWRSALMTAAFDLVNHIKPLGRDNLGLSVGLKGNGMAFTHALLREAPWQGSSITEDIDYGLDLLQKRGVAVGYAPAARVVAQMPTTARQSASQRERWERGRYKLMRERALPLFCDGLLRGDVRLLDAALDLVIPPLAELFALCVAWLTVAGIGYALGVSSAWVLLPPAAALFGYGGYVLGGLRVAEARSEAYSALLRAPVYAFWKFALLFVSKVGKKPGAATGEWVRTERHTMSPPEDIFGNGPTEAVPATGSGPELSAARNGSPAHRPEAPAPAPSSSEGTAS